MTTTTPCRSAACLHSRTQWGALALLVLVLNTSAAVAGFAAAPGHAAAGLPTAGSIGSPALAGSRVPNLAAFPDGRIAMSWMEPATGGGMLFRLAVYDGRHWSRPSTIAAGDSFFVNWADVPSVRPIGGDRLAAHWLWRTSEGTYSYDVRVSQSEDGGRTWSTPVTPHRDGTASEHGFVSLLPDSGGALAVWLDGRKTAGHGEDAPGPMPNMTIRAASITSNGGLRGEAELDGRTCDCCPTSAVTTSRGVLVAYRDRDADEVRDIYVTRREAGVWTAPHPVHADKWQITGCPVNGPSLAATGSHVAIGWFTAAADSPRVYVAFSEDAGDRFGPPVRIDEGNTLGRVSVALLADGSALATWLEASGKDAFLRVRRIPVAGPPEAAITVARTSATRSSGCPRVVTSGRTTLIAWTESGTTPKVRLAALAMK